ncbi:ABC transporter permease [Amycolatopsis sp. GM8]|uniref:ABC transporter permease n=1 Tax=Amycolatopsis sp. GM8 TaxID=2896530 RepID=UPI001F22E8F5|nr:ABC transporter permease [Amycolatopsis sp. GM8]
MKRESRRRNLRRLVSNRLFVVGAVAVVFLVAAAILIPWFSPYGQFDMVPADKLRGPSASHWLGTDDYGRDLATRLAYGVRTSLGIGVAVAVSTTVLGAVIGLASAWFRRLDGVLMRIMDGLMAFPSILLAICMMAAFGAKISNVIIALTIVFTPQVARIVRSSALSVKEEVYVLAMVAQGASSARIIFGHLLPNIISPIVVQASFVFADAIISEASLSFLGAGVPPPGASLGSILHDGKILIFSAWWIVVFAGIAIVVSVFGLNFLGDGLRDYFDPKGGKVRVVSGIVRGQVRRLTGRLGERKPIPAAQEAVAASGGGSNA